MDSVEQELVGTASGINNAVARAAGVLAVAVLGFVMTAAFALSWRQSLATLNLNAGIVRELQSHVSRLDALDAPSGVDSQTAGAIRYVIADVFVFGFRLIVLLCAVLSVARAGIAWRKISGTLETPYIGGTEVA